VDAASVDDAVGTADEPQFRRQRELALQQEARITHRAVRVDEQYD
jgi:hypothetical protein